MQVKKIIILSLLTFIMQGCLVFNSVSYEINLEDSKSGNVTMKVTDIRTDAMNASELDEDKNQLFQFILKRDEFIEQMKDEGKNILNRQLFISEGKLNGSIKYSFNDVSKVEGIAYQEPFYFITLGLEDSIISTNGEVIISEEHKRIMWDNSIKTMKFEMFSANVEDSNLVELSQYLEED